MKIDNPKYRIEYTPKQYTPKQVRILARACKVKIRWYEYIFNGLLRKRLFKYFNGDKYE